MASIPLRAYNREIEGLIDHGQVDEAIAHCMHILQFVPKHIGTYRLLGKAFLESKQYSEAADIFQRVLASAPDDFVANIGMSIIREDEKNLDGAIWHMERAFEAQPSNAAIQDELRRLYGKRDGLVPPKVRLTRGALSRMYFKGNLFSQAIGELRAALSDDPQRTDLQILLAQAYYANRQQAEAVDICNTILKKLPFCLEANRILAAILTDTNQALNAKEFQQRLVSLDPYYASTSPKASSSDEVPEKAVVVDKLDYKPGAPEGAASQPAWASSLGVAIQPETQNLPEWLSSEGRAEPAAPETSPEIEAAPTAEEATPAIEEQLPDWMKESGWSASTGPEVPPPPLKSIEETPKNEGELSPGEVPDWLREIAPQGALEQEPPAAEPAEGGDEVLPWLQEAQPGASDTIISWLDKQKPESTSPVEESQIPGEGTQEEIPAWMSGLSEQGEKVSEGEAAPVEDIPDWIKEFQGPEEPSTSGVTDWLSSLSPEPSASTELPPAGEVEAWMEPSTEEQPLAEEAAPEKLPLEPTPTEEGIPDWLKEIKAEAEMETPAEIQPVQEVQEQPVQAVEPAPEEEIPDWLKDIKAEAGLETPTVIQPVQEVEEQPAQAAEPTPEEELPDWLKEIEAEAEIETPTVIQPAPEEVEEQPAQEAAPTPEEEIPDWLKAIKAEAEVEPPVEIQPIQEIQEPPVEAEEPAPEAEIPDWLKAIEAEEPVETAPTIIAPEQAIPEVSPEEMDEAASLAWLESLARKQGVPEEQLTTPAVEQPAEEPAAFEIPAEAIPSEAESEKMEEVVPEWLSEEVKPESAQPAGEIPEWMKAFEEIAPAEEPEGPTQAPAVPEAVPTEEIPDWLKAIESEGPIEEEPTLIAPAQAEPAINPEEMDEEAAIAWLESLAAKQRVPEEQLTTPSQGTPEEAVPWAVETPAEELQPPVEEAKEPERAETGFPDWLIKATEPEAPLEPAQQEEAIPDWLASTEGLASIEAETPEEPIIQEPETVISEAGIEAPTSLEAMETSEPAAEEPAVEGAVESEEAALAWLESLARKTGVPEEQLVTHPLKSVEEPPDWVKADVEEAASLEETKPIPIAAEPEAAPAEETEPTVFAEEVAPVQAADETLPSWLVSEVTQPTEPAIEGETASVEVEPAFEGETAPVEVEPAFEGETARFEVEPVQKLDINEATLSELEALPGIGFILAQMILNYKEEHGSFSNLEDLNQVPGIGPDRIEGIRELVEVVPMPVPTRFEKVPVEAHDEDEYVLQQGRAAISQDDLSSAIDSFTTLVHKKIYLPEVITELTQALTQHSDQLLAWQTLGDAYLRNDQLQEALDAYMKAEELLS